MPDEHPVEGMFHIVTVPGAMSPSPRPVTCCWEKSSNIKTRGILWKISGEWPSQQIVPQGWGWEPGLPAASELDVKLVPTDVGGDGRRNGRQAQEHSFMGDGVPCSGWELEEPPEATGGSGRGRILEIGGTQPYCQLGPGHYTVPG